MKRNQLRTLLEHYHPQDQEEMVSKQTILKFINQHPDCFERSLRIGHITASAWLINNTGTHALLMHHAKLNKWVQLGGHCDGESDVCAVALKEAHEESGLKHISPVRSSIFDIDIHLIPANHKEAEHYHYDIRFLLRQTDGQPIVQNHESNELRWVSKNKQELPTDSRSVVRMFEKWVKQASF